MPENKMKRVSRQEFIRYTSKYLKKFPFIVTNRGEDELFVQKVEDNKEYFDTEDAKWSQLL